MFFRNNSGSMSKIIAYGNSTVSFSAFILGQSKRKREKKKKKGKFM